MSFDDISKSRDVPKFLDNINKKSIIIFSETSIRINKIKLDNSMFYNISTHEITKDVDNIDKYISKCNEYQNIISIGGGTASDIAKYLAYKTEKNLICIPTMLSTNVYSTNKVALIKNGIKNTLNAKIPDLILIDETIMSKAIDNNLYGLADVFSIYTALKDWDISIKNNSEKKTKEYYMSNELLEETITYINTNSYDEIVNNPKNIFYLVGRAGEITNLYGSGKPESGSEHIFAKELERIIAVPHGIAVANGIILMSIAQNNYSDDIYYCLNKLKIFKKNKRYGINVNILKEAFFNLVPREDRYSIVNKIYLDNLLKETTFNKFEKILRRDNNI